MFHLSTSLPTDFFMSSHHNRVAYQVLGEMVCRDSIRRVLNMSHVFCVTALTLVPRSPTLQEPCMFGTGTPVSETPPGLASLLSMCYLAKRRNEQGGALESIGKY